MAGEVAAISAGLRLRRPQALLVDQAATLFPSALVGSAEAVGRSRELNVDG